ncbi:MAG: 1-(5-phosphoribosyl)-5-[(5-phosphoribosylamino)methylideneamino] imidazole-4-carboxamide isomerase [Bacillota bacterium]|nr:1-(5-phosphoribosyl)-5-[(5-phosphoribosylamino)methylideneamino] imidazole-4-carboxamide isomerase [Bacillota bacterium]
MSGEMPSGARRPVPASPSPVVIPAIDVMGGRCVRLHQGDPARVTVYDPDPAAVAARFAAAGARRLHLVDLDAALGRRPARGIAVLRRVIRASGVPVQFGGGIRSIDALQAALAAGASWIISATAALEDRDFLPEAVAACGDRLIVALDLRGGRPAVRGWQSGAAVGLQDALAMIVQHGVHTVLVTDTAADGTLGGIDLGILAEMLDRPFEVIAAGGVSTLEDVRALAAQARRGLAGIVSGSALLQGRFTLAAAQAAADGAAADAADAAAAVAAAAGEPLRAGAKPTGQTDGEPGSRTNCFPQSRCRPQPALQRPGPTSDLLCTEQVGPCCLETSRSTGRPDLWEAGPHPHLLKRRTANPSGERDPR